MRLRTFEKVTMAFALTAAACGGGQEDLDHEVKKEQFTSAVERVADDGGEDIALDPRVPCDFDLLTGRLVVKKLLGPNVAVVADKDTGKVPEFGLVDCVVNDDGVRVVRGSDGY